MKKQIALIATALMFAGPALVTTGCSEPSSASDLVVVYKSPTCGCCGDWITHMRSAGFEVEVHDTADLTPIKERSGVGPALRSCHTAVVGGYVLEGHVPAEQVTRLLAERPDIRGLAVPGMPIGSPGMDVGYDRSTWQDYDVVAFAANGDTEVYAHIDVD
jgi:hypothetical protein